MSHYAQRSLIYVVFIVYALVLSSCDSADKKESPQNTKKDSGILKTYERGPVTVTLQTDKQEITIADRLNLTISVTADEAYEVELPGFGEKLEQFGIVDYHTSQPKLTDEKRTEISRSYVLEPFLSGDYTIPPMKVSFWKKGEKETSTHDIETEEITIHVTSILPKDMEKMTLHDIKPPVTLPTSYRVWIWTGSLAGAVLCIGLAAFFLIKRRRKADEAVQHTIPAHELAFNELEALVAENLVEKGEVKRFYQNISDILRRYIERRFGIHAPEQTTEEFLAGIKTRNDFPKTYNPLIKNFLTHCDLVKFAEHQPTTENIQQTFDSCQDFILGTRLSG
jgi:hypothetical protein